MLISKMIQLAKAQFSNKMLEKFTRCANSGDSDMAIRTKMSVMHDA